MKKQIVILGGGTGGTMTANRLRRHLDVDDVEIHVVDRDNRHIYQPGLLFVPFGLAQVDEIVRPRRRQLRSGIVFHESEVESVWVERDEVLIDDGTILPYDVLVVATGVELQPEETEGLTGAGWNERAFTFYTPDGAEQLQGALQWFDGGRVVVNLVDMPIKCPVAPLEFVFLADWYFRERKIRDRVEPRTRRRSTAPSRSRSRRSTCPACSQRRRSSWSRSSTRVRWTGPEASSSPTTSASSTSTCSSRSRSTAALRTSSAHRVSATRSASSRRTRPRCSRT